MYQVKVPKGEKPDSTVYTIHHCHTTQQPIEWNSRSDYYRILSIDPGKRNFCFRIEVRDLINKKILVEAFEKIDLIGSDPDGKVRVDYIFRNTTLLLDKYYALINSSHLVIIERQLHINYKMVRFSQHIITYLMLRLRDNYNKTVIMEIDSTLKTRELSAPRGLNKNEVKKWSIEKADALLRSRNDVQSLNIIRKSKTKKDDLSDTVVQIEAVFHFFGLPLTEDYYELINVERKQSAQNQLFAVGNSVGVGVNQISRTINISPIVLQGISKDLDESIMKSLDLSKIKL